MAAAKVKLWRLVRLFSLALRDKVGSKLDSGNLVEAPCGRLCSLKERKSAPHWALRGIAAFAWRGRDCCGLGWMVCRFLWEAVAWNNSGCEEKWVE